MFRTSWITRYLRWETGLTLLVLATSTKAYEPAAEVPGTDVPVTPATPATPTDWPISTGWKRLSAEDAVWVHIKHKQVMVEGRVCLRKGVLEMFACPKRTKEHESVVAINARSQMVHTALLAVGAKPGHPVRYQPTYEPATGSEVAISVVWRDPEGKEQRTAAQQWIKNVKTNRPLEHTWVFAGSTFWKDPETGKHYYQAENGEMVCLSNFGTALLDLPVASPDANADLLFRANTERIPPVDTPVRLVFQPRLKQTQARCSVKPIKPSPPR